MTAPSPDAEPARECEECETATCTPSRVAKALDAYTHVLVLSRAASRSSPQSSPLSAPHTRLPLLPSTPPTRDSLPRFPFPPFPLSLLSRYHSRATLRAHAIAAGRQLLKARRLGRDRSKSSSSLSKSGQRDTLASKRARALLPAAARARTSVAMGRRSADDVLLKRNAEDVRLRRRRERQEWRGSRWVPADVSEHMCVRCNVRALHARACVRVYGVCTPVCGVQVRAFAFMCACACVHVNAIRRLQCVVCTYVLLPPHLTFTPSPSTPSSTDGDRSAARKVFPWPKRAEDLRPGVVRCCVFCALLRSLHSPVPFYFFYSFVLFRCCVFCAQLSALHFLCPVHMIGCVNEQ